VGCSISFYVQRCDKKISILMCDSLLSVALFDRRRVFVTSTTGRINFEPLRGETRRYG
jgi:hypothetical protein